MQTRLYYVFGILGINHFVPFKIEHSTFHLLKKAKRSMLGPLKIILTIISH